MISVNDIKANMYSLIDLSVYVRRPLLGYRQARGQDRKPDICTFDHNHSCSLITRLECSHLYSYKSCSANAL